MSQIEILHGWTKDGLELFGIYWNAKKKDICTILIHGMSGNIIENYFAEMLGEELSKNNIGFIYGHNRGYSHINDIKTRRIGKDGSNITKRYGAAYEKFDEGIYDVQLWIDKAKLLCYKKIILMGHSLGCNKTIHFLSKRKDKAITGLILASPPDMVGLAKLKKYQPNYSEMVAEARKNVESNEPRKLLQSMLWNWYYISSETFLNLFVDHCPADNLPILRNPDKFGELAKIEVPILALFGEKDDSLIHSPKQDLYIIQKKAVSCPKFNKKIIKGASHVYGNKERELAKTVTDWIKSLS